MASLLDLLSALYFAVCCINMDYHLQDQSEHQLLYLGPSLIDTFGMVIKQLKAMSQFLENTGSQFYNFVLFPTK